jgi:hypothetical protein
MLIYNCSYRSGGASRSVSSVGSFSS